MTVAARQEMSVEDFLAWCDLHPEARVELIDGVVVQKGDPVEGAPFGMGGGTLRHSRTKLFAALALERAAAAAGLACVAALDDPFVAIGAGLMVPDVALVCGPVDPDARMIEPVIVVEVLSPSSAREDQGRKPHAYLGQPFVAHVLVLDAEARTVQHYRRDAPGRLVVSRHGPGETLALDPPGLVLAVAGVFEAGVFGAGG